MRAPKFPVSSLSDILSAPGLFAFTFLLAGCSTSPPSATVASPESQPQRTADRAVTVSARPVSEAPRSVKRARKLAKVPATVEPDSLLGLSPQEVLQRLGPPKEEERNTLSREWVYAVPGCRFSIFFYPSVDLTSLKVLKYRSQPLVRPQVENPGLCVRQIQTARDANEHS